ncbi:MAG: BPSS1780 family membrane protein [Gammaproteobacteria bacterium]
MNLPTPNKLAITQGLSWISRSFSLFGKGAGIWIVMLLLFVGINLGLTMVPFLELLPTVLAPGFTVGFYIGCRAIQKGEMLQIDYLFHGFKQKGRLLIRLGLFFFLWNIVIYLITSLFLQMNLTDEQARLLSAAQTQEQMAKLLTDDPALMSTILNAALVAIIMTIPLIMASWFSPALVAFHEVPPLKAMTLSLKAFNRNLLPFVLYFLIMLPLTVLAFIPLALGLLIILPVIIISQYVSYQAVFPSPTEQDDEPQSIITL